MDQIFWIPIGAATLGILIGAYLGGKSRSSSWRSGALVGVCLGLMATFPLIALGFANS